MVKPILQIGDPILTTKTKLVTDFKSEEFETVLNDLLDTCKANYEISAGLAAPQIGYNLSMCVVRRIDLEEREPNKRIPDDKLWEVMINPKIVKASKEQSTFWEGCLSIGVGDDNLWAPVSRPRTVTVEFKTPDNQTKRLSDNDYFSHSLQHEVDHVNGVLFLNYVTDPEKIWTLAKLQKYLDEYGDYPPVD